MFRYFISIKVRIVAFICIYTIFNASILFAQTQNTTCVTIGIIGEFEHPTKGYSRYFGQETLQGASVAVDSIKNNQCFKLQSIETHNKLSDIPFLIEKAAIDNNIHLFIGLGTSEQAMIAIPALKKTNSYLLSPTASDEQVIKNSQIITFFPSNKEITESISSKMIKNGMNKAIVIYTNNHYYAKETQKYFIKAFKQQGGSVPLIIPFRAGNLNLYSYKKSLLAEKTTPVFLPDCDLDAAKIILELKELGSGSTIIGSDSWSTYSSSVENYLEHAEKTFTVKIIIPKITESKFHEGHEKAFNDYFQKKTKAFPTDMIFFSYDSIFSIQNAVDFCGNKNMPLNKCLTHYGKEAFGDLNELKGIVVFEEVTIKNK